MSEIAREIATQPECWRKAAEAAPTHADALPTPGARVAVVGCGTSWFVAQSFGALREATGQGETDAFTASEMPPGRAYDLVLVITRSGTTTEVLRLLETLGGSATTVVTAVDGSPATRSAGATITLPFADERSVVQTRSATSALALLRAHVGGDLEPAIADAEAAIAAPLPVDPARFDHFVSLGRGWTVGLANEAALKLREAAGAWAESYPAMEFRHGPISLAGPRSLVWTLGAPDPDLDRDVRATGASVLGGELDPMAELVLVQRTAVALAEARGLDPDKPRHLSRSVVLS
ncbi:MAG TPA: SIS domain-containing protein [Actinomycetota bacterium]|nr:SIS domain-containing protein [Actinomycetota bacterium]